MNKKVVELTVKLGKVHVEIAKLNAEIHVLREKIWGAKSEDIFKSGNFGKGTDKPRPKPIKKSKK